MILWRLRGITSEFVCSIQRAPNGYRLVVSGAGEAALDQLLPNVGHAQMKAARLREELIEIGFSVFV
jgi:hypothetical protein